MTTTHSLIRAKERQGYNAKTAEHVIRLAMERGKRVDAYRDGREKEWLAMRLSEGYDAVIYNGYCYILKDNLCITLYEVPEWFGKRDRYVGRERIRNIAKYQKKYLDMEYEAS